MTTLASEKIEYHLQADVSEERRQSLVKKIADDALARIGKSFECAAPCMRCEERIIGLPHYCQPDPPDDEDLDVFCAGCCPCCPPLGPQS